MLLPKGTIVAVAGGEKFNLFSDTADEGSPALAAMSGPDIETVNKGSGASHQNSSGKPDESQAAERRLRRWNRRSAQQAGAGWRDFGSHHHRRPRTLGELRKNYHKKLSGVLRGEISKDLTGHAVHDTEKAIATA